MKDSDPQEELRAVPSFFMSSFIRAIFPFIIKAIYYKINQSFRGNPSNLMKILFYNYTKINVNTNWKLSSKYSNCNSADEYGFNLLSVSESCIMSLLENDFISISEE